MGLRDLVVTGLRSLASRVSIEPRYPETARIAQSSRTLAGVAITPDTAITVSAVWACIRYLSQTTAAPPWHVFQPAGGGSKVASSHSVDWLLWKRPSPEWSSFQFRETLMHWALRWGNGYAEIEPDLLGRPAAMWPIHPERVDVCRANENGVDAYGEEIAAGTIYYEVRNDTSEKVTLSPRRMYHLRGFGEGPVGLNVIQYAAQSIGWARAAQLFGASYFGNGATPATVVLNKKPLKEDGLRRQRAEFEQLYKGPTKAHKVAHLDNDATISRVGSNAQESQLIEVHQHLIEEICRWFGVPPHKVAHLLRSTFNNIEHQAIEVVQDSITPWVKRFEDEADYKLFGEANRRGYYTKINLNALLRGDMKARLEFYRGMVQIGAYSPNRVLEIEDENTIGEDGNIHVMQEQFSTLEFIREKKQKTAEAPTPEEPDDDRSEDVDEDADEAEDAEAAEQSARNVLTMMGSEAAHAG